jgi:hypothetical protein
MTTPQYVCFVARQLSRGNSARWAGAARRGAAGLTRTAARARAKRPIAKSHSLRSRTADDLSAEVGTLGGRRRRHVTQNVSAQTIHSPKARRRPCSPLRARARLHRDGLLSASLEARQCAHRSGICETMAQVFASMPCENGGTMICRNAASKQRATANMQRATANTWTAICHQAATLWLQSQRSQRLRTHPGGLAHCRARERWPLAADKVAVGRG